MSTSRIEVTVCEGAEIDLKEIVFYMIPLRNFIIPLLIILPVDQRRYAIEYFGVETNDHAFDSF